MIALRDPGLSPATALRLARAPAGGRRVGASYAQQVAAAKELFPRHSRGDRPPFREVRQALAAMCSGLERCMYCEDAPADEVEHVFPKDLYPATSSSPGRTSSSPVDAATVAKSARFRVFHPRGEPERGRRHPRARRPGRTAADGDPLLIDPRREDPLDFLWLDLSTFFSRRAAAPHQATRQRAAYTIDVLGLNRRAELVRARGGAYRALP